MTPKQAGYNAYWEGLTQNDNPYFNIQPFDHPDLLAWDWGWEIGNSEFESPNDILDEGLVGEAKELHKARAYQIVSQDLYGKVLAERDLNNLFKSHWWKVLTKYRNFGLVFKTWEIRLYLFQENRWELGINFDINGDPLLSFNLIFIHIELEFTPKNGVD